MKFASRTDWDFSENPIIHAYNSAKTSGRLVSDLTESNPTRCGFISITADILKPFANPENLLYSPDSAGMPDAREAVGTYYRQRGYSVDPERIILTSSTSEAYTYLFRLLCEPGDAVMLPKPSYPLFDVLSRINDIEPVYYDLVHSDGAWEIDQKAFMGKAAGGKAVMVVNPNNPTGNFLSRDGLSCLSQACKEHDMALICDEVFWDYQLGPDNVFSLCEESEQLTFVLSGLSKIIGAPQLKLSWIVINGPDELVKSARQRLEVIADTYLSVNTPVQNAAAHCLTFTESIQREILNRIRQNLIYMNKHLNTAEILPPRGGWYAVLKLEEGIDAEDTALRLLKKHGVYVHPGYMYDFADGEFLVISLIPKESTFCEGIDAIQRLLSSSSR